LFGAAVIIRPLDSVAQSSAKTYRLASLTGNTPISACSPNAATLLNATAQRGYTLGNNLAYDARGAAGELKKIPLYVAEFQFRYNNRANADIFGAAISGC